MKETGINLLRSQSVLSPSELAILEKLKFVSIVFLIALLTAGFFVGTAYAAANLRLSAVENERTLVTRKIGLQAKKEVLLTSIKERIPSIEKTLNSQLPWPSILASVSQVANPPQLETLSIDQKNILSLGIKVQSLEELEQMLTAVSALYAQKKIRNPVLDSLQTSKEGIIKCTIRFTPVF